MTFVAGGRTAAGGAIPLAIALLLVCHCGPTPSPTAGSESETPGGWNPACLDQLLMHHVRAGLVDYAALRSDPGLEECSKMLASTDVERMQGRSERLAFWINAYNLLALKGVADAYPVRSIREIGVLGRSTFFRGLRFRVGSRERTLDTIEHKILRSGFHEARIHFALASASRGGPRLRSSIYHAETLDSELDDAAREFISDPAKVRLDREAAVLYLSPVFDWFAEDFERAAGSREEFVRRFLPEADAELPGRRAVSVRYLDFDWALNDLHPAP